MCQCGLAAVAVLGWAWLLLLAAHTRIVLEVALSLRQFGAFGGEDLIEGVEALLRPKAHRRAIGLSILLESLITKARRVV